MSSSTNDSNNNDHSNVENLVFHETHNIPDHGMYDEKPTASSRSKEDLPKGTVEPAHVGPMARTFINKQRTLVFAARGIYARHRHLLNDVRLLLPHGKSEGKFHEQNATTKQLQMVNDICRMKKCPNCIMFECTNQSELFMHMLKTPTGPSVKFAVTNIVTMNELKMTGNCLKGSRAILHFDKQFDSAPHFQLIRELFTQIFATPKGHPKTKPFMDHMFSFYILDGKIWFRHYQIALENAQETKASKHAQKRKLVEIGPRFVLEPLRILSGSMEGEVLYNNDHWVSLTSQKREKAIRERDQKLKKIKNKRRRIDMLQKLKTTHDPVQSAKSVFHEDDEEEDGDDEEVNYVSGEYDEDSENDGGDDEVSSDEDDE